MTFLNRRQLLSAISAAGLAALAAWALPPTSARAESPEAVAQASIQDVAYRMDVSDWEGPPGEEGYVIVAIRANKGFKINKKYPQKVSLAEPPAGLSVPMRTFKLADAQLQGDSTLLFTIPVTAERVGEFELRGRIKLSVCSDSQCRTEKHTLQARIMAQ